MRKKIIDKSIEDVPKPTSDRADKILKERRLVVICDEIAKGQTTGNIAGRIEAEWDLSASQADRYISEALVRISASYAKFSSKAAEILFDNYQYLHREQLKANEKAEARKTLDSMCRLLGVNKEQPGSNSERPTTFIINTGGSNSNAETSTSVKQA